jgi:hypothetical protein
MKKCVMAHDDIALSTSYDAELDLLLKKLKGFSRATAIPGLIKKGDTAVPPLIDLLRDNNKHVRHCAAYVLEEIGSDIAVPPLIDLLRDGAPKVRQEAAEILGEIGGDAALKALTIAQNDPDRKVSAEIRRGSDKIIQRRRDGSDKTIQRQREAQKQRAEPGQRSENPDTGLLKLMLAIILAIIIGGLALLWIITNLFTFQLTFSGSLIIPFWI